MQLHYEPYPNLPRLAWLLEMRRGEDSARVLHGPWVETRSSFVCDGAWDGSFVKGEFEDVCFSTTFGARTRGDDIVISTPSHPFECLYTFQEGERIVLSPSLAFVLEYTNQRLSRAYIPYTALSLHSLAGTRHFEWALPIEQGGELGAFRMRNLTVTSNLTVVSKPKPLPPSFPDFDTYHAFLVDGLKRLAENASDPERMRRYPTLSTISSGYDAAACSVLSLDMGCTEAITITSSRRLRASETSEDLDDSGTKIGEILGLEVQEYERGAYREDEDSECPEAEFVAVGALGQDLVMKSFEDAMVQRLVLTGAHGDSVWSYRSKHPNVRDIVRTSPADTSLGEFRTRVGFIWAPVPCFGAMNFPEIQRITRSEELSPWSIGGDYDRPIPRRILEDCGVERSLFGTKKRAITVLLENDTGIEQQLSSSSLKSFRAFLADQPIVRKQSTQRLYEALFALHRCIAPLVDLVNRVLRKTRTGLSISSPIPLKFQFDPGEPSHLIHWGLEHILDRYATDNGKQSSDPNLG